jgi:diacylglycerol O-acyltransferase / wax synthase
MVPVWLGRSPLPARCVPSETLGVASIERLSRQDQANLLVEAPDTPMHMAVLTVFEGPGADLPADQLLDRLRDHVRSCLDVLPELRRVLHSGRIPGRAPAWGEDRDFRVEEHVLGARVAPPGGDEQLLAAAADLLECLLDRSRPLWEMWLLTGLTRGRWATLLKVHHSLTDGYGMLQMALAIFDGSAGIRGVAAGSGGRRPALLRLLTCVVSPAAAVVTVASVFHRTWKGRRADLLRPIGTQRRLEVVELDLAAVKDVAHSHEVKVNDVLLELTAAGILGALNARRRRVDGVVVRVLMAVSPLVARDTVTHNRAASVIVSLPLQANTASERLLAIAVDSRRARRWQRSGFIERSMVFAARTPLRRFVSRHQRVVDLAVSNLVGPNTELRLLGDRMVRAIPVTPISGNVTINFCALSYAGQVAIGITADAGAWPDLPVVTTAMRSNAGELGLPLPRTAHQAGPTVDVDSHRRPCLSAHDDRDRTDAE